MLSHDVLGATVSEAVYSNAEELLGSLARLCSGPPIYGIQGSLPRTSGIVSDVSNCSSIGDTCRDDLLDPFDVSGEIEPWTVFPGSLPRGDQWLVFSNDNAGWSRLSATVVIWLRDRPVWLWRVPFNHGGWSQFPAATSIWLPETCAS